MLFRTQGRRPIGQILTDGGFLSQDQLEQALEEQKQTNELLGQVLVRMGILDSGELNAVLSVQEQLGTLDQAVKLGAGVRQMLGSLLIHAGQISVEQLEQAIAEQKRSGDRLGEVCMRLGLLSEGQLDGLLAFQSHQTGKVQRANPLRLGEVLISAGHISRGQLDDALHKQTRSGKKLGEVLVEEGYAHPAQIDHGMHLQHLLMTSVLAAVLSLATLTMSGCGGGGGGGGEIAVSAPATAPLGVSSLPAAAETGSANYFQITDNDYSIIQPNFYYSSDNDSFWSIQANIAKNATDVDTVSVFRIDIQKAGKAMPSLNKTFSIEDGTQFPRFPGDFLVFNGDKSVNKKVERGIISFAPDSVSSGKVHGTFDVTLTDYDSERVPAPQYHLKGAFNFVMGSYGPAVIAPM